MNDAELRSCGFDAQDFRCFRAGPKSIRAKTIVHEMNTLSRMHASDGQESWDETRWPDTFAGGFNYAVFIVGMLCSLYGFKPEDDSSTG